jgi:hypothetical protein
MRRSGRVQLRLRYNVFEREAREGRKEIFGFPRFAAFAFKVEASCGFSSSKTKRGCRDSSRRR